MANHPGDYIEGIQNGSVSHYYDPSAGQVIINPNSPIGSTLEGKDSVLETTMNHDIADAIHGPYSSLADYISHHPGMSGEDYLEYMSQHSDEYAEQYMNYLIEKDQLNAANQYTASREDSAYQRLVADLRAAGLNPAMMYGGSASISSGGSMGYIKQSEGSNSRGIGNYTKLKQLLIATLLYQLQEKEYVTNSIFKGTSVLGSILGAIAKFF